MWSGPQSSSGCSFFFQAEDGIRDLTVTGVQTCALPISPLGTLWKRLQEKPKPPVDVDPTIPKPLNDIVMKALEVEPEDRWARAREMAHQQIGRASCRERV